MGKDRKERKEKKSKKDRKEKSRSRKRGRYSSSSDDSSDEEDRRRREASKMAKKVERHLKKHGGLGGFGYTDEDNPFGDANLVSDRFVWGKKIERQLVEGTDVRELTAKAEQQKQAYRLEEIEKVQKRREQREAERNAMQEELEMIQRERAMAEAVDLERKEEEFHLEQAKVRARQRLEAGRPKAIDLLTNNLFLLDGFDPEEQDPGAIVASLNVWQLKDLKSDVTTYAELDSRDTSHASFWRALAIVADFELSAAVKQDELDRAKVRGLPVPAKYLVREPGWHESLDADVAVMLAGKSLGELATLEGGIHEQLDSGEAADPEYWAAVLKRLEIYKARAVLREFHHGVMERQLDKALKGAAASGEGGVPKALVGGKERMAQARAEADRLAAEVEAEEVEREAAEKKVREEEVRLAAETVAAAGDNAEEIDLPEDEDEEKEQDEKMKLAIAAAEDAELEALAAVDIRLPSTAAAAGAPPCPEVDKPSPLQDDAMRRGEPGSWEDLDEEGRLSVMESGDGGDYSPRPLAPEHVVGHDVVPEEEDSKLLAVLRAQVKVRESQRFREAAAAAAASAAVSVSVDADRLYRQMVANPRAAGPLLGASNPLIKNLVESGPSTSSAAAAGPEEAQFRAAAARAMGDLIESGDVPFGGEVAVHSQVYWWHEKYRPRKPKYFNRVHTGYDWNKYNKTHYDGDNPPPKTVQGYKFNIFYPDLIDPGKAPSYKVEEDPESYDGSTCIVRFSAGPPYEDIAFRIVNKNWELNPKRGFKCVFERGILHLYFNYKREFYRR